MFLLALLAAMVWAVWMMCVSVVAVVLFFVELAMTGLLALSKQIDDRSLS
jgi:hypothetical protein